MIEKLKLTILYFRMTYKPCAVKVRDPVLSSEGRKMVWPTYFHTLPTFWLFNSTRFRRITQYRHNKHKCCNYPMPCY